MCHESFYLKYNRTHKNAALRSNMDQKRKAHIKEVPSCHSGIRLASLVSWDLIGIGSILFLRYIEKDCIPRSQERHGYEEKDFFQVFFLCWERGLRSELSEFSRRWLSQRNIAVLLFGNFTGWWFVKYCVIHEIPIGQNMG